MKRIPLAVAAATPCLFATLCSAICLAAFLTTISASAATDAQTSADGLSPVEEWVVARITAGKIADLSKEFFGNEIHKRKLSAHFLEALLPGALPGVKPHRNGARIFGATIDEPIDLRNAQIAYEVWLDHCQFMRPVTFVKASFAGNAMFSDCTFKADADFSKMKVGGTAGFFKAVLEGRVDFTSADIASDFEAKEAQFENKEQGASFSGMKVGGYAWFNDAVFEGPANLILSNFGSLDLSSSVYHGALKLLGMNYKFVRAALNEPESHDALLNLANRSMYDADVYGKLEAFFLRQGYRGDADRAFIEGKRRERKEKLDPLPWIGSFLLDLLVGYGRRPWQAGIPRAFLVALGCFLFSPKRMEPQKPEDAHRVYNRFWYSLGLFLPFVDLQADKVWKPKPDQTFLRNYMRAHILLGWILVPLVLAALTGLIK